MHAKPLTKVGNSNAIILDKTTLSLINADESTVFKISVEANNIILSPVSKKELHEYAMKKAKNVMKTQKSVLL